MSLHLDKSLISAIRICVFVTALWFSLLHIGLLGCAVLLLVHNDLSDCTSKSYNAMGSSWEWFECIILILFSSPCGTRRVSMLMTFFYRCFYLLLQRYHPELIRRVSHAKCYINIFFCTRLSVFIACPNSFGISVKLSHSLILIKKRFKK